MRTISRSEESIWRISVTGILYYWEIFYYLAVTIRSIVLKYSGHAAMWFGPVLGQHLWQLKRLAWKHKNVNATYLPFILEGIKIV